MTPLERAARAHYADAWDGEPWHAWENVDEAEREGHRRAARAVLNAIREPSDATKRAGTKAACAEENALEPDGDWHEAEFWHLSIAAYQAMIDAALEKEGV